MEGSMNSYMQKPFDDDDHRRSPDEEESGWTAYFEDFSNQINNRQEEEEEDSYGSPSLVSDAGSAAAWKFSHNHKIDNLTPAGPSSVVGAFQKKFPKKLKFKKSRTKEICDDDSLEDTASSPVNSPKVSDFEAVDMNIPRKNTADHDHMYSSLGKGLHQNITHRKWRR